MEAALEATAGRPERHNLYWHFNRFLERHLPGGLYPRSLIIVVAPIVVLQGLMAWAILESHWDHVTKTLSKAVARDMAFVVALYESSDRSAAALEKLQAIANRHLEIGLEVQRQASLPSARTAPLFSMLDYKLSKYVERIVEKPFWIDTVGQTGFVDARVEVEPGLVFRFLTSENRAYASNTYIFLLWMIGCSLVLLVVAIVFLRNQIRPILRLAHAAQSFGMGRDVENFRPSGATEVRQAAQAFVAMKERIERHVEQRTAMLAGVSHDLRTVLTRFKLELALLGDGPRVNALKQDVEDMQRMLEGYIAFVRGDGGERSIETDIAALIDGIGEAMERSGRPIVIEAERPLVAPVKTDALKRCIANLVTNAARFGRTVKLSARRKGGHLVVTVDDDGPGIPAGEREAVFRPFVRLDDARNQDEGGTGLGLAIARDIAHSHGGHIRLADSPLGGLRAVVAIPV
jgi:two-component system osmolarity sensor histidine kinase EnvZ